MASSSENRLTTVVPRSPSAASKKLVFTYDYMGRRVRKRVYSYSAGAWNSTPTTDRKFVYDGWNLLLELNGLSSDAVLRKYTWGLDLSGQAGNNQSRGHQGVIPGLHDAGGIGGLLSMRDVGTTTSLMCMYGANGDVGQLVKVTDGSLGAKYQYYPYGGEIQAVGTYASTNPFRFSTKYWDAEHQAYYYGYRYHKPKLGRWMSRDPIDESGGMNLYNHTENSPTCNSDPTGLLLLQEDPGDCLGSCDRVIVAHGGGLRLPRIPGDPPPVFPPEDGGGWTPPNPWQDFLSCTGGCLDKYKKCRSDADAQEKRCRDGCKKKWPPGKKRESCLEDCSSQKEFNLGLCRIKWLDCIIGCFGGEY